MLIVDDHSGYRRFARRLLEADALRVVGEAADGAAAVLAVTALRPDVVLLDVQLPDMDGFAVAECLAAGDERPVVVLTSSRELDGLGERLRRAPVAGFIPKDKLSGAALVGLARRPP